MASSSYQSLGSSYCPFQLHSFHFADHSFRNRNQGTFVWHWSDTWPRNPACCLKLRFPWKFWDAQWSYQGVPNLGTWVPRSPDTDPGPPSLMLMHVNTEVTGPRGCSLLSINGKQVHCARHPGSPLPLSSPPWPVNTMAHLKQNPEDVGAHFKILFHVVTRRVIKT